MQENIWYNIGMPKTLEKKNVNFSLKLPESLLETLGKIGEMEDRPLGYVGRELMIRGLRLYLDDGRLRDWISSPNVDISDLERRPAPVVATISGGKGREPSQEDVRRMITADEIAEAARRTTPRKRKAG